MKRILVCFATIFLLFACNTKKDRQTAIDDIKKLFELAEKHGAKLITTEKDWVRLPENVRDKIKYAQLDTKLDNEFWNWLKEKIK